MHSQGRAKVRCWVCCFHDRCRHTARRLGLLSAQNIEGVLECSRVYIRDIWLLLEGTNICYWHRRHGSHWLVARVWLVHKVGLVAKVSPIARVWLIAKIWLIARPIGTILRHWDTTGHPTRRSGGGGAMVLPEPSVSSKGSTSAILLSMKFPSRKENQGEGGDAMTRGAQLRRLLRDVAIRVGGASETKAQTGWFKRNVLKLEAIG